MYVMSATPQPVGAFGRKSPAPPGPARGRVSFSISEPRASGLESQGIRLRNSKLSRISWTVGEKPSR